MTYGVYCIEHVETGRKYIGKSKNVEKRFQQHKSVLIRDKPYNGVNSYLWNLVNKWGIGSLKFWLVEEINPQDDDLLADREVFWMDYYCTLDRDKGFNLKRDSSSGTTLTQEAKDNIRKAKLGSKNPNFGKPAHPNTLRALKARTGINNSSYGKTGALSPHYGVKRSEETKERLRDSKLGENNPNYGLFGKDNPCFGMKRTPEQSQAISQRMLGKTHSDERKLLQKEAVHKHSYEAYSTDGVFIQIYQHPDYLVNAGFYPPNVHRAITSNGVHKGCYWRKVPKVHSEDVDKYNIENSEKMIVPNRLNFSGSYLYEQYSFAGEYIRDYSSKELKSHDFDLSAVIKATKGILKSHKGFKWQKIPKVAKHS